jgi:hypothetical protein
MAKFPYTAGEGAEMYYPKKWTPLSAVVVTIFLISLAECFRQELSVRIMAAICVVLFGGASYFAAMDPFLALTGLAFLKLSRDSLSFRYGNVHSTFRWNDIQSFRTVDIPESGKTLYSVGVVFNDTVRLSDSELRDRKAAREVTKGGFDGLLLPNDYGWKAEDLAQYLNGLKARYGDAA